MVILQVNAQLAEKWLVGQHMSVSVEFVRDVEWSKTKVDMPLCCNVCNCKI